MQRGAVVVRFHLVSQDVEADFVFLFASAAGLGQFEPGRIVWQRGGPFKAAGAGVLESHSSGVGVEAHHHSVLVNGENRIGRSVDDLHLEIVEIEHRVELIAAAVGAEGEAFKLPETAVAVKDQGSDVRFVVADLNCHAVLGAEVQGVGNGDPLVHRPAVSVQRRLIGAVQHLVEIEGAVVFSPDLHTEGLHAGRSGEIDGRGFRLIVPVDLVGELDYSVFRAAGEGIVPDAVIAVGALAVQAVAAVGVSDVGFVAVKAVGASHDPVVLALEIANLHIRFLKVFLVDDVSAAGRNENVGGAGRAAVDGDHGAIVIIRHGFAIDGQLKLDFILAGAFGIFNLKPAGGSQQTGGVIEAAGAGVDHGEFRVGGGKAGVQTGGGNGHDRLVASRNIFALDVVKVELGVPIIVAADFVGAEGKAGESPVVHIVEGVVGNVSDVFADLHFHALHGIEVDGVGNIDPFVHRPGLAVKRRGRIVAAVPHLVEIEGVLTIRLFDLHAEGLGGIRSGDVNAAGVGAGSPVNLAGNFHYGHAGAAFDGGAGGCAAAPDAVVTGGPVGVHDLGFGELGFLDLGLVGISAVGASHQPAFLVLQVALSHEGLFEVFFVEDRAVHPVNADHFEAGVAGVDGHFRPCVLLIAGGREGQVLGAVESAAGGADGQPVGAGGFCHAEGNIAFGAGVLKSEVSGRGLLHGYGVLVNKKMRSRVAVFHFHLDVVVVGGPFQLGRELGGKAQPHSFIVKKLSGHGNIAGLSLAVAGHFLDGAIVVVPQKGDLVFFSALGDVVESDARRIARHGAGRSAHVEVEEAVGVGARGVGGEKVGAAAHDHLGADANQLSERIVGLDAELRREDHVVIRGTAVFLRQFEGFAGETAFVLDHRGGAVVGGEESPAVDRANQFGAGLVALEILLIDGISHQGGGKRQKKRQEK